MTAPTVLIVLTSADRRGAEVEGSQLAAELTALGVPTSVVALRSAAQGEARSVQPLDVPSLGDRPLSWSTLRALRRLARGVDVVVAFGSSTLPACALALAGTRTPFVYRSIGDPARWVRGAWHRRRTGLLFRRAAHVVALWPEAAASISNLYRVPSLSVTCIPNARQLPTAGEPAACEPATGEPTAGNLSAAAARQSFGVPADAAVVAWVGALSPEKRPVAAVESVAAMADAWLLLAGEGALRADVAATAAQLLPGRHRLVGVLDDLSPLWAAADVVLLTSATEGMPGVLIEAALHGVPAVATDVGAVATMVDDGRTGRVVPAGATPTDMAAALRDALTHRAQWGDDARAHAAARFTWPTVTPLWADLLRKVGSRLR